MLKRKFRSIAALTSAVLFINAGICTFTATAAEITLPAVESTENISDEIYFATLSGVLSTEVGAYAGTELVGYTLDRFYEIGESPIEFQIEDETVAEITQIQGTIVNIKGISTGETTLTANLPNGKTLSIEVIVSEPICTTTTAIFCPYPSYTTTTAIEENDNQTEVQEYYSLYIDTLPTKTEYMIGEELDITGTKIYGSYTDGELVGDIFPTDLAPYLENGMMTIDDSEFDNTKAGTYTIYIHYGTATASFDVTVTDEAVIEDNAVMIVEITEIDGDTLFVRQSGNSGDLMTLSVKHLDSNIQPTVGMKLEVTYSGYILETYPAQFGNIKKVSAISDYTSVAGDANGDGDFTIADMVTVQRSIMGRKTAILSDYKAADLYEDGKIDVYDFILMRKNIVEKMK